MSPVFGHGRLRLYLLKLLDESPRHGYDVIRLLEDRFLGVYAPSAGTIYPRLARLEEEGLVTHDREGGRKIYRLTDAGRAELNARMDELSDLEREIEHSVRDIAREVTEDVRDSVRGLREELKQATRLAWDNGRESRKARREGWDAWRSAWEEAHSAWHGAEHSHSTHARLEELLDRFHQSARQAAHQGHLDEDALRACSTILDDALTTLRASMRSGR